MIRMTNRSQGMMKAEDTSSSGKIVSRVNMDAERRDTRSVAVVSREALHLEMCRGHQQPEPRHSQNLT
jgi:hypothetical protein